MMMKLCIYLGICLSSQWFLTFSFLKAWADNGSTNQYSVNCLMARGWHTLCHPTSKMHNVGQGPGKTPSALRCLSYPINSFLTDIKHFAKNQQAGPLPVPFWCLCQKLSLSLLYFNRTLLHKKFQVAKSCLWSQIKILSSGGHKSHTHNTQSRNTRLTAANFHPEGSSEISKTR